MSGIHRLLLLSPSMPTSKPSSNPFTWSFIKWTLRLLLYPPVVKIRGNIFCFSQPMKHVKAKNTRIIPPIKKEKKEDKWKTKTWKFEHLKTASRQMFVLNHYILYARSLDARKADLPCHSCSTITMILLYDQHVPIMHCMILLLQYCSETRTKMRFCVSHGCTTTINQQCALCLIQIWPAAGAIERRRPRTQKRLSRYKAQTGTTTTVCCSDKK